MRFSNKLSKKLIKTVAVFALFLTITITGISLAFGDFSSEKVLGVGRIQSAAVQEPVAATTKFVVAPVDSVSTESVELSDPIVREAVEAPQAPEPDPEPEPEPEPVVPTQTQTPVISTPTNNLSGDEDAMLQWIIQRESSGNPNAENGVYKGIGQLHYSYYPRYVGVTWEEAKGNYDIQLTAMLGYINTRYGSITNAYNAWQQKGWY